MKSEINQKNGIALGLVGCGKWGANILRDLIILGCEVSVVARSAESRQRAQAGGARAIYDSIAQLPALDGYIVASPTELHFAHIQELAGRGKAIYVEKPLCIDVEEARWLEANLLGQLFVMDKWRYHAGIQKMREVARSQVYGKLQGIYAVRVQAYHRYNVNTLWIHLPHDLAIIETIVGEIPPLHTALLEYTAKQVTGASILLGGSPWANILSNVTTPFFRREVRLVCEQASICLTDGYATELKVVRLHSGVREIGIDETIPFAGELPLLAELRAFVSYLQGGEAPLGTLASGRLIIERIAEILAQGKAT